MPVVVNRVGYDFARSLIARGAIDDTSAWEWTADDENSILGDPPDWDEYQRWHLGRDEEAAEDTKAAWKYPFGKDGKIFIAALRAIRSRAAQNDATSVFDAAGRLLELAKAKVEGRPRIALEARAGSATLFLYGDVGRDFTAAHVAEVLERAPRDTIVRLNSYGGDVIEALAISRLFRERAIIVEVDGIAASAASLLAVSGAKLRMRRTALLMIHGPHMQLSGRADDLREAADLLDTVASQMLEIYARKAPKLRDLLRDWLTDRRDHWISAEEAVKLGLADETFEEEGPRVSEEIVEAKKAEVVELPRIAERNRAILAAFAPFRDRPDVAELERQVLADLTITEAEARERLLAKLAEGQRPAAAPVQVLADEGDKARRGILAWLYTRAGQAQRIREAGLADTRELDPGEYRGMTLAEIAARLLDFAGAGVHARGLTKTEVITRALSTPPKIFAATGQTTSDFAVLLENVLHKTLVAAYRIQRVTWPQWAARTTVNDFRVHTRYRVGSLANLPKVDEAGLLPYTNIPDGEKATIRVDERGYRCGLPRQAIVNDDLGAFTSIATQLGQAARRSEEVEAINLLVSNPTMSDGQPLFSAAHNNVGTAAAPSVASFDEARRLMASQRDPAGSDFLDLRPAVWLGPIGISGDAMVINDSQYDPDAANKLQRANKVRGLFSQILGTPRLTGTAWYAFADPAEAPAIEVAFLAGEEEPRVEQTQPWETTGLEWRVIHVFGVAAVDWRAAVRNPGA